MCMLHPPLLPGARSVCVTPHALTPALAPTPDPATAQARPSARARGWRAPVLAAALVLGVCAAGMASAATAPRFRVLDLGDLPGGDDLSEGLAISAVGSITGTSAAGRLDAGGRPVLDAFVHEGQGMAALGGFDPALVEGRGIQGFDINASGQVVGQVGQSAFFNNNEAAFVWQGGQATLLPGLPGSQANSARGINDAGTVVGFSALRDPLSQSGRTEAQAFIVRNGQTERLPGIDSAFRSTLALGVNNRNEAVGIATDANGRAHAALWQDGRLTLLGGLSGARSNSARAINDLGQVVGGSNLNGASGTDTHAFFWNGSSFIDMGTLVPGADVIATDLNNQGLAVGIIDPAGGALAAQRPFLWSAELGMLDLNTLADASGWTLTRAFGINDQGQIAAIGVRDGVTHALRLDAYTYAPAVPEPASLASLALGLAVMGTVVRWRQGRAA